ASTVAICAGGDAARSITKILLSGTPLQSSPSLTASTELATKDRCALFQASDFDDRHLFRCGIGYSCGAVCPELLAAALVASAASSGALSLAAGVSAESTMTSALPASGVGVRSRSST